MRLASIGPSASLRLLDWEDWLYQLVSALIAGGASAVTSAFVSPIVDSGHFNPTTFQYYELMGGMFLGTGLLKMCVYLQAHPLPTIKTTTTVETIEKPAPNTLVVTTTEETKIESPEQKKIN